MDKRSTRHSITDPTPERTPFLDSIPLWQREKAKGWISGVVRCGISAFVVFAINISTVAWISARHGFGDESGRQTLYEGSCHTSRRLNTGIHLLINTFSTVLLSSSNYCMQCLSAPTREEVDRAHLKGKWLDIGIMSIYNLRGIALKRVALWCVLGLSSIPLHLFYNATVFQTVTTNLYLPIEVTSGFILSPLSDNYTSSGVIYINEEAMRLKKLGDMGALIKLDNLACINTYTEQVQTQGSVLLVIENSTSIVYGSGGFSTAYTDWVCGDQDLPCDISPRTEALRSNPAEWRPGDTQRTVSYCLSEHVPDKCKVQSTLYLTILVTALSLAKAIIMLSLPLGVKESPLMTIGDAIASFLWRPDLSTENMCLVSKQDMKMAKACWPRAPRIFKSKRRMLFSAISKTRWILCAFIYVGALIGVAFTFYLALPLIQSSNYGTMTMIRQLGINGTDAISYLVGDGIGIASLIGNVIIANLGQIIASLIYFSYNGLVTSISTALEWESYACQRKGLRVSGTPHGEQRCTYFLQLPYRTAVPLMILSGLLHWLVSQSFFLLSFEMYQYDKDRDDWSLIKRGSTLHFGCSPLAIILILSTGVLMIVVLFIIAMMRFRTATPIVASCSAAIAAACHTTSGEEREDTCISQVQWGVTGYDIDGIGHCAFSMRPVDQPQDGMLYRGRA